jgi:hypothetical protein
VSGLEHDTPRAGRARGWGGAVDDVAVLFDYGHFEPVRHDDKFVELTRAERSIERARDTTTRWRGCVDDVRDQLRSVVRTAVCFVVLLSGVGSLLGVQLARLAFAASCLLVVGALTAKRVVARRRAREAARLIAEQRRALTLIDGPRRVPVDVLLPRGTGASATPLRMRERIDSI